MSNPHIVPEDSWLKSERVIPRRVARPLLHFLDTEAAGGIVLFGATLVALLWANSPWSGSYRSLWTVDIRFVVGDFELGLDVRHWINEGLMTLFFFVVALEIKREMVAGELNDFRKALVPVVAALGGMAVPALLYVLLNAGGAGEAGWGIPMATDIAFAVGVLALLSKRIPSSLKVFLLSLAIVDDIGAIVVIAVFYAAGIELVPLSAAILLLGTIVVIRRLKVYWIPAYVLLGSAIWLALLRSGVHPTIAGATLGFLTPARPINGGNVASIAERLGQLIHPWTSYLVIPLFALANAGFALSPGRMANALGSTVTWGIVIGLVLGKLVGISGATWLAVKFRLGRLPEEMVWRHVLGAGAVAGIGFTVSLFITALAFDGTQLIDEAKTGVLVASLVAGLVGVGVLAATHRSEAED